MIIKRDNFDFDIDVDILEEIDKYDWYRARVKGNEMVACSPFRDDQHPSFSINLESGLWQDFAGIDYWNKGNLITLLSFLRNETPSEVEDYLLEKYGIDLSDADKINLNVDFNVEVKADPIITIEEYKQYGFRSPYLGQRGITERVQSAFKIGYDKKSKAVAFAWQDIKGQIINVKFRSTTSKQFYYHPNGQQLKNHIYGMNFIYKMKPETAYLVESEIDALYLWSHGFPAIALGGSKISEKRKQLLLRSPIKKLVLATDNDAVGHDVRNRVTNLLVGSIELFDLTFPSDVNDVNELDSEQLKKACTEYTPRKIKLF